MSLFPMFFESEPAERALVNDISVYDELVFRRDCTPARLATGTPHRQLARSRSIDESASFLIRSRALMRASA